MDPSAKPPGVLPGLRAERLHRLPQHLALAGRKLRRLQNHWSCRPVAWPHGCLCRPAQAQAKGNGSFWQPTLASKISQEETIRAPLASAISCRSSILEGPNAGRATLRPMTQASCRMCQDMLCADYVASFGAWTGSVASRKGLSVAGRTSVQETAWASATFGDFAANTTVTGSAIQASAT